MRYRSFIALIALAAAVSATMTGAWAFDESKYPQWKGEWRRVPVAGLKGQPSHDPDKSEGLGQQAPLTSQYQAILEASIADQAAGGPGNDPTYTCLAPGMPRVMIVYDPMEIIITPGTTHMLMGHIHDSRRIFTDGRDWADELEPTFQGHSIGRWIDSKFDGHYDQLLVETRAFMGPRVFDSTGLPLHEDNQTIIKERIYQDAADANVLHDEITTIDHALTRPWTVTKSYRRMQVARPVWREVICAEGNQHVKIGQEAYFLSADGYLMPTKKDQLPPDLKHFRMPSRPPALIPR
ncbi:MAG TPA: hypothetical protein VG291_03190 [Xanthobacteraceae bacterium]|nr:hypothetical protein [Xanthobacteraceae bacterium]